MTNKTWSVLSVMIVCFSFVSQYKCFKLSDTYKNETLENLNKENISHEELKILRREVRGLKAIVPGTKWCGAGNNANSYRDLGTFSVTDSCCREHDYCPNNIKGRSTKHGLKNTDRFTKSHCDCDAKFYKCLKQAGTTVSDFIGDMYFNILGMKCFREDYPAVGCLIKRSGKCVTYATDKHGGKRFQFFDNPYFK